GATQRAGRAGRLAPGPCTRLWTGAEDAGRREHEAPEILRVDLARTVLELAAWGLRDVAALGWLDAPPPGPLARARTPHARPSRCPASGAHAGTGRGRRRRGGRGAPRRARGRARHPARGAD